LTKGFLDIIDELEKLSFEGNQETRKLAYQLHDAIKMVFVITMEIICKILCNFRACSKSSTGHKFGHSQHDSTHFKNY